MVHTRTVSRRPVFTRGRSPSRFKVGPTRRATRKTASDNIELAHKGIPWDKSP